MKFYDELISSSPFFMRDLAKKLSKTDEEVDKIYKKIYMQVRYYHKSEWECKEEQNGMAGRSPLKCVYIGVSK